MRAEVVIVGAGPAGSATAIACARAGLGVVVVDKSRFPRDKCCGDGLTTGTLRRLETLGVDPRALPSFAGVDDLFVRSPSGRIITVPLAGDGELRAAVARRAELDAALLARARAVGARVLEGRAAVALEEDRHGTGQSALRITCADGTAIAAPFVVAADGAWSPLRRLADELFPAGGRPPGRRSEWHAFRTYAHDVDGPAADQLWVSFPPDYLPGYVWSFPLSGGRANIGLCIERGAERRGAGLQAAWQEVLASPFLDSLLGRSAAIEGAGRSWPIPAGIGEAALSAAGGRLLFVGDAARAADPFTGEGVGQALESGMAAAAAIVALGGASARAVAEHYHRAIAGGLAADHRVSWAARALMATPLGARAALRGTDLHPRLRRQVGRWLYEDYPRSLVARPWRWRPRR